jgi:zinc D-Ala-D-Ala dipeptidase
MVRININNFSSLFLIVSLFSAYLSMAQELEVVSDLTTYQQQVKSDSLQQLVDVADWLPAVTIDLRYASKNNFTGQKLYTKAKTTFVRLAVAKALRNVQQELSIKGYNLKIWDAYRPYDVTKKMWELIGDERYVANPAKGSGHNRGLAIDLTLVKEGKEVNMGTAFDNFSDTAHHDFTNLPVDVLQHRLLLKTTMEKYGFKALDTEWWHYSFPNDRHYGVLNIPFKKLKNSPK